MIWMWFIVGQLALLCFAVFVWYMRRSVTCPSHQDMHGRVVIVTGGNSGVGFETAKEMARRRARVIVACRSKERGESAVLDIIHSTGWNDVRCEKLDLTSFRSVREFAQNIINTENAVHVLINNAAAVPTMAKKPVVTEDKLELQWQTNYFGHFLLTMLLLPMMVKSGPTRIVNVSSCLYKLGRIEFDNFAQQQHRELALQTYCNTKLALVVFTRRLAKLLRGTNVSVFTCTPGTTNTNIARHYPWFVRKTVGALCSLFFCRSAQEGAQTLIYLAVEPKIHQGYENGLYFVDCQVENYLEFAKDEILAQELFETSEKIVQQSIPSFDNNYCLPELVRDC